MALNKNTSKTAVEAAQHAGRLGRSILAFMSAEDFFPMYLRENSSYEDITCPELVVSSGAKAASLAWKQFNRELSQFRQTPFGFEDKAGNTQSFILLRSRVTGDIFAIRDYGRFDMQPADFLFRTEFVTFTPQFATPVDEQETGHILEETCRLFEEEIKVMQKQDKPLFLLDSVTGSSGTYLVTWSFADQAVKYAYDFKSFYDSFYLSDTEDGEQYPAEGYTITPPSEKLSGLLGLNLVSADWEGRKPDTWEPMEPYVPKKLGGIYAKYQDIYMKGVELVNIGRKRPYGNAEMFSRLEEAVQRMERLEEVQAMGLLADSVAGLIQQRIHEIKEAGATDIPGSRTFMI
ncbi:MAG: hypothetical protein LUG54_03100 [Clostridiales bacterium]|nr:hypothetical protein [Clostridiales bacterium]